MRNQYDRHPSLKKLIQAVQALELKLGIPNCQCLIDDDYIGINMGSDCESKAHHHATGIGFYRLINELADFSKFDDRLLTQCKLFAAQAKQPGSELDVPTAGFLWIETGTQFQQCCNTAQTSDSANRRRDGTGEHLQQSRFATAIAPYDPQYLTTCQIERNIP